MRDFEEKVESVDCIFRSKRADFGQIKQGGWGSPEGKDERFCYLSSLSGLFTAIYDFIDRKNGIK